MPDTRVSSKCCTSYRTSSGGQEWAGRCRRQSATASNTSSMKALMPKPQMWPIIVTALLHLLHIDFTSIETTMELDQPPNVVNTLVFCNHLTKHVMAYMTPNQTAKTVAMFLWQGYILIFRALATLLSD